MADLIFYTNPQSRGRIVRWMLEEIGAAYETEVIAYDQLKGERYLAVNPMGKVPAIKHRDHIITESAAICAYLADVFPEAGLSPRGDEKADYYRWLFYAAGPVEQAVTNHYAKWDPAPEQMRMFGYGSYDKVVSVLDELFSLRDHVCGDRFHRGRRLCRLGNHVGDAVRYAPQPRQLHGLCRPNQSARSLPARLGQGRRSGRRDAGSPVPARIGETGIWLEQRIYSRSTIAVRFACVTLRAWA